ncbi:MAG TPA: lysylphosphatidylglycerol synthase domain-containing protein [Chitinispirillaceae bacterium]|nr:lysylphosphatidylglycerol synthase domain-containing protein [Chitinispirillaceae bacterium]
MQNLCGLLSHLQFFLLSGWLGVIQWIILLKNRGIPLKFWNAFRLYFVGLFFNNFIMGGIVGDAVKIASIKSQRGRGMAGLAATFLDRFAGLWAMCGFAVAGSFIL